MTRRSFAKLWTTGAAMAPVLLLGEDAASAISTSDLEVSQGARAEPSPTPTAMDDKLQSEFLLDLVLERGPANNVGSLGVNRVVVPVASGTFEGPKLRGTVVGPAGDWIVVRPDGSSVLDLRLVLETDDAQKIYMTSRGIAYTPPGGSLWARILPAFETGAAKYAWLNNVVAVGVHRPMPAKVAYRIYRVL